MIDLRAERLRRGKSVREMARIIGVTPRVLLAAEQGARPHPGNALRIAQAFDVDVIAQWPPESVEHDPQAAA